MSRYSLLIISFILLQGCDHGLVPPPEPPLGVIRGHVTYEGTWPAADSVRDLRFVAFQFVPRDTSDFFRFTEFIFSDPLNAFVPEDEFMIDSVEAATFLYSGVAQHFGAGLLDWRPIGLYKENDGRFTVTGFDTLDIHIHVDFDEIPRFPPP